MINDNIDNLLKLGLINMADNYKTLSNDKAFNELNFDEQLALLLQPQVDAKNQEKIKGLIRRSRIKQPNASLNDIHYYEDRELDKKTIATLATGQYIEDGTNVCVFGATGAGKTFIVSALGIDACNRLYRVRYIRLPDLLYDIEKAKNRDKYMQRIKFYINFDLLIIDDWLLVKATPQQQEYLFEIMEGRNELHSTIFASQTRTSVWHDYLGGGTIADAILDRITSSSYTFYIKGNRSMRARK